jgi:hypothetical protein
MNPPNRPFIGKTRRAEANNSPFWRDKTIAATTMAGFLLK